MALVAPRPVCQHCGLPEVSEIHRVDAANAVIRKAAHPYTAATITRATVSIMKACELTGVSRRTIYNWIAKGKVEWVRTAGGSVRIFADSLFRDLGDDDPLLRPGTTAVAQKMEGSSE